MNKFLIPIAVFVAIGLLLAYGLSLDPKKIPSPLIGKPLPAFALADLHKPNQTVTSESLRGKVYLLNVWASWCVACRDEHPLLVELARQRAVPIIGLNYKDKRADALRWLEGLGNPYDRSLADTDGRVGIELGVYGVPETFVIDKAGTIRYKHIGPISPDAWRDKIAPLLRELNG
jgi:cytochrome c biogenesis protein CcmG/thiol:disulfide interchange protein DsbE